MAKIRCSVHHSLAPPSTQTSKERRTSWQLSLCFTALNPPRSDPHHLSPAHHNKTTHSEPFLKVLHKCSYESTWSIRSLVRSPQRAAYRALLCYFNDTINNLVNIYMEKTPAAGGLLIVLRTCKSNIWAIGQTALTTALKMHSQQQRASSEGTATAPWDFWVGTDVPLLEIHTKSLPL